MEQQKAELIEQGALSEFEKRLRREWSIETGIVEKVYTLDRGQGATLLLSFHSIGPRFRGVMVVRAYLSLAGKELVSIKGGMFQINYEETFGATLARFSPWLDRVIVGGLNEWRRTL